VILKITVQVLQAICACAIVLGLASGHNGCLAQTPKCYRPPETSVGGGISMHSRLTADVSVGARPKLGRTDYSDTLKSTDQFSILALTRKDASGWYGSAIRYRVAAQEKGPHFDTVAYRQLRGGLPGYRMEKPGDRVEGALQIGILEGNLLHDKDRGKLLPPQNVYYLLITYRISHQIMPHIRVFGDLRFHGRASSAVCFIHTDTLTTAIRCCCIRRIAPLLALRPAKTAIFAA